MFGIEGIEAMEFGSGVLGVEPPVDGGSGDVSLRDEGLDLPPEGGFVGDALLEAAARQDAELYLRHIQPTAVLGGVVKFQPFGDPPGFGSREGLVQGRCPVSVQIVQDQPHHLGFRVGFIYQWLADDTAVQGATGSSYTLSDDNEGNAIKVIVSFTDDAGNEESLTSPATAAVREPLTVSMENEPSSHDGENVFTFELRFSEEVNLSFRTLKDHAFTVDGGEVKKAKRIEKGSNIRWRITVMPDGDGQVTITLPVTEDCTDDGAICTEDGRMLSNRLVLTVSGPGL